MANTTRPLTATQIKQAKPKAKEYSLGDGGGLFLRIKPNGSRLWIYNYSRPHTKARANIGLGQHPSLSLAGAREQARKFRALLASGIDPQAHRTEQARKKEREYSNTLQKVADKWLKLKREKVSPSYFKKIESRLQLHVFPKLGRVPISNVNAVDTIETLEPLSRQGKLETVANICGWLNEILVFSVNSGLVHANPLAGISRAFSSPKVVNLPALEPEELPELMLALANANIRLITRSLIEWQLHTMTRPGESAGAGWAEIDEAEQIWRIPAARMKSRREHVVPLTHQTLALLDVIRPFSGSREFLFPSGRNPSRPVNSQTANAALKRMGFRGRLCSHGLRSIASTTLNEQGFDAEVIEGCLAHVDPNTVRRAYNRTTFLERRRAVMNWWSEHIELAAEGNFSLSGGAKHLRVVGD